MSAFQLKILTPDRKLYEGEAAYLSAATENGSIGVLAHHAPLLTALAAGKIICRRPDGTEITFDSTPGFLRFDQNQAVITLSQTKM